jgi:ankyrin repeat protein
MFQGTGSLFLPLTHSIPAHPAVSNRSVSLLHIAAFYDNLEMFLQLIELGVPAELPSDHDFHPLHYAAVGGATEVAHFICASGGAVGPSVQGVTPLYLAALSNSTEIVRVLLRSGSKITGEPSPMGEALRHRNGEMIGLLLGSTAGPLPPLMKAIEAGFPEAVPILLQQGADPNFLAHGKTALSRACFLNQPTTVQLLLDYGASVQVTGRDGQTAIHWAVQSKNLDIVKMVVRAGPSPADTDGKGCVAWLLAVDFAEPDGAKHKDKAAKEKEACCEIIKYCIGLGMPVNVTLTDGTCPVVDLFPKKVPDLIALLLEKGLDMTALHNRKTLLEWAQMVASKENMAVFSRILKL